MNMVIQKVNNGFVLMMPDPTKDTPDSFVFTSVNDLLRFMEGVLKGPDTNANVVPLKANK